jgi:DNA-directed RNA polymerase subunit RPC12/RpoP
MNALKHVVLVKVLEHPVTGKLRVVKLGRYYFPEYLIKGLQENGYIVFHDTEELSHDPVIGKLPEVKKWLENPNPKVSMVCEHCGRRLNSSEPACLFCDGYLCEGCHKEFDLSRVILLHDIGVYLCLECFESTGSEVLSLSNDDYLKEVNDDEQS